MIAADLARRCRTHLGQRSIVIVGMMGAGKTSLGRRLAKALHLPFHDADVEIEKAAGKTISDIFAENGEEAFRSGEEKVIRRLLENGPQVLATGGGAFMRPETRKNIEEFGLSVWIDGDVEILWERVSRRSHRPLLQQENPKEVLRNLLQTRNPTYALADIKVVTRDEPHEVIVREIAQAVDNFLNAQVDKKTQEASS